MPHTQFDFNKTFDVIIVGAGPAGCVLASRLSEESNKELLLIEAGPDAAVPGAEHPDVLDPFAPVASNNSAFHWPGLMAETRADRGDGSARAMGPYLQGYGVGGASNINGMGVDRGQPGDYDEWRDLGAADWAWKDVLPYFKKLEHDLDFSGTHVSSMHGGSGPMPVRRLPRSRWAPFAAAIGDALQRRGFDFIEDYTADFREGFSAGPTNSLPDRRVSASMAYLTREVRRRPNLKILANTRADRLSLEGTRARVPTAFLSTLMASRRLRAGGKLSSHAVPSKAQRCSCALESVQANIWQGTALGSCKIYPGSGPTCKIVLVLLWQPIFRVKRRRCPIILPSCKTGYVFLRTTRGAIRTICTSWRSTSNGMDAPARHGISCAKVEVSKQPLNRQERPR